MCGICGTLNHTKKHFIDVELLKKMVSMLRHRGPDEFGIYVDNKIGMGNARLSIIDLQSGSQPIHNEDETIWIVFNGEIYNYIELRKELILKGHRFYTQSDTEAIIHLYEEYGTECLEYLNGQFAFAIWDSKIGQLMLARDRPGIRPLFYTICDGSLIFGSEIKSILADSRIPAEIDIYALDQIFSFWTTLSPRTIFKNIWEIPPGHFLTARNGNISIKRYWHLDFPDNKEHPEEQPEEYYAERLRPLLIESTKLRLRADVPVGAYLSGGLDSSAITAIIRKYTNNPLKTFSIQFADKFFDETPFQREMIEYLNTDHREIVCTASDIGRIFPEVIWHTETPILRTAPAPLYLLSKLVRDNSIKVVLTGEGADEFLAGYNIFKEAKIRRFWAKSPDSKWRPLLLQKLYPYIAGDHNRAKFYWEAFFKTGLSQTDEAHFSHIPRWENTSKIKALFSDEIKSHLSGYNNVDDFKKGLSENFNNWHHLCQAQYIEIYTFFSNYLLSSQGDRVAMANSVEGRFPFLDHHVVEFCSEIPPKYKLKVLEEKHILRKSMEGLLPENTRNRPKQPYRAPDSVSFLQGDKPDYVSELLSPGSIKSTDYFNPDAVNKLVKKCERMHTNGIPVSAKEDMAIVGILSLQLLDSLFIRDFKYRHVEPINVSKDIRRA